jgi:hypothetical protein
MIAPDSATMVSPSVMTGRLAERVDGAQFRRRQHRLRIALVFLDLVVQAQFFKQPQDALRARVVQMVDGDH